MEEGEKGWKRVEEGGREAVTDHYYVAEMLVQALDNTHTRRIHNDDAILACVSEQTLPSPVGEMQREYEKTLSCETFLYFNVSPSIYLQ